MPLDDADKAAIADMIKGALSPAALSTVINAAVKPLTDKVEAMSTDLVKLREAPEKPATPAAGEGEDPKKPVPVQSVVQSMLAPLQKQLADEKAARQKAESDRRRSEADAIVREKLLAEGIRPEAVPVLMNHFRHNGSITDDAEANATGWKSKDQFGNDMVIPVGDGIEAWAKSSEADTYRPARGVEGTGLSGGRPPINRAAITTADGIFKDLGFAS